MSGSAAAAGRGVAGAEVRLTVPYKVLSLNLNSYFNCFKCHFMAATKQTECIQWWIFRMF